MPPVRTQKDTTSSVRPSSSKTMMQHTGSRKRKSANPDGQVQALPGVQKIKAALRQTRRLLAKDKLAANVRVETERRLKSLEADLAKAELGRKEKKLADRYHAIKFFERQKVTRKLNRVKRELESCEEKKEKKKLSKQLLKLRVDLNYILHYPKLKKYISLFPPEARNNSQTGRDSEKGKERESPEPSEVEKAKTEAQREEIRQQIREAMERGDLSNDPEIEELGARVKRRALEAAQARDTVQEAANTRAQTVPHIQEDDFFGEESGSSSDEDRDIDMDES